MPSLWRITGTFFTDVITRLGVRPPPGDGFMLSDMVQPVSIFDSNVAISTLAPTFTVPSTQGETAAPADTTLLADTGALSAGTYDFRVIVDSDDTAATASLVQLQRRDSANATSIWSSMLRTGQGRVDLAFRATLALNERIRVIKKNAATAATTYQASIFSSVVS